MGKEQKELEENKRSGKNLCDLPLYQGVLFFLYWKTQKAPKTARANFDPSQSRSTRQIYSSKRVTITYAQILSTLFVLSPLLLFTLHFFCSLFPFLALSNTQLKKLRIIILSPLLQYIYYFQHFIKEEKNHVGWCLMKFVPERIFHQTCYCVQHQKYMLDSFKVVYHPTFNFQHHFYEAESVLKCKMSSHRIKNLFYWISFTVCLINLKVVWSV